MAPTLKNKQKQKQIKNSNIEEENSDEELNVMTDEENSIDEEELNQNETGEEDDSVDEENDDDAETDEGVGEEAGSDEAEDNNEFDINMSDTSSSDGEDDLDEDEEEDDDEEEQEDEDETKPSKAENIRKKIQQRYDQSKGKRLYVRFPEKLPESEDKLQEKAKALSPLIKQVHRPRQKHARFCLVDFDSQAERDTALEKIRQTIQKSTDENVKKIVIDIPRTESSEFVENLVDKKLKTLEKKAANRKLKKIGVAAEKAKKFTSTLVVTNLPKRTSVLEVRSAYPKAIDVRIKRNKAAVTFPTTFEARAAYKQPPTINGMQLKVRFDKIKPRKRNPQVKKVKQQVEENVEQAGKSASQKRALPKTEQVTETAETETTNKRMKKTKNAASTETKTVAKASSKPQKKQKFQKQQKV